MYLLLDQIWLQSIYDIVHFLFGMNVQIDRLRQIQREDTHDGFGINNISAGYQIKFVIKFCDLIHKRFYFVDRI